MKRKRDYAAERSRRDAKYRKLGYKSYNDYERERRNKKAKANSYKNYYQQRKMAKLAAQDPIERRTKIAKAVMEKLGPIDTLDQLLNVRGILDWDYWRWLYFRMNAA